MKFLFLYTRLPDYFYQSILYLSINYNVECFIVRHTPDKHAPYIINSTETVKIFNKIDFINIQELYKFCKEINPSLVYVSGWADNDYNKIIKKLRKDTFIVSGLDNLWQNTILQKSKALLFGWYLRKLYNYIWVSGSSQYTFAKNLGFKDHQIIFNLYCANQKIFQSVGRFRFLSENAYPKTIIYFGRFVRYKKVVELLETFIKIPKIERKDWKLILVGEGELRDKILEISDRFEEVIIKDFMQPTELAQYISKQGVFCLPSKNEHWGLVIHEAALSGVPIITSSSVGAASKFVINGYNGYIFNHNELNSLEKALKIIMNQSDDELKVMSSNSVKLSNQVDHNLWAASLIGLLK